MTNKAALHKIRNEPKICSGAGLGKSLQIKNIFKLVKLLSLMLLCYEQTNKFFIMHSWSKNANDKLFIMFDGAKIFSHIQYIIQYHLPIYILQSF